MGKFRRNVAGMSGANFCSDEARQPFASTSAFTDRKKSQNQSIFILQFQDVARIARHPALLDELDEITESIER